MQECYKYRLNIYNRETLACRLTKGERSYVDFESICSFVNSVLHDSWFVQRYGKFGPIKIISRRSHPLILREFHGSKDCIVATEDYIWFHDERRVIVWELLHEIAHIVAFSLGCDDHTETWANIYIELLEEFYSVSFASKFRNSVESFYMVQHNV